MFFRLEIELTEKVFGGLTATDMKLIDRGEIVHGDVVDRLAKRLDPLRIAATKSPCV